MDLNPRNQFNCKLANRYWDIPTDIPKAVPYNTPIGTKYCDQLGFMCHPQKYTTFHGGLYRNIPVESQLYNLDYYNPQDYDCQLHQQLSPELIREKFSEIDRCQNTPKVWRNHSKLHKFNTPS